CMIVLCASVLIYYASRYEASVEMMRREDGPHHTVLMGVKGDLRSEYTNHSYVKDFAAVDICARAQNPNILASLETVSFTAYDEKIASFFYLNLVEGRLPEAFGEVIVSEQAARYFEGLQMGAEQEVEVQSNGHRQKVPFRVVGTFTAAAPASAYVFCTAETAAYLRGGNAPGSQYTSDVYLIFEGSGQSAIKRNMDAFIEDIGMVKYDAEGNEVEIEFEDRNKMLTEIAQIAPYYEGSTMLVMFLFSLLPAGIALAVFIYLDLQKNLKELATLSMIGATWKQIFRMQFVKYAVIFFTVFPFGIAGAAALMRLVCALTENISKDRVYLWFHFDFGAMFVLWVLSTAILLGVVFILSKRMTSVAYAQMLSAAHKSGNIFVAKTSDILFREKRILERIAVLFFTRNRGINRLFCVVIVLLVCVYAFFSQQISVEYNEAPSAAEMELADFYLYGDIDLSSVYETMIPETADAIAAIPHVERIQRRMELSAFYTYLNDFLVESNIQKQLVSNTVKNGQFGQNSSSMPIYKRNITDVRLIGADEMLLDMRVGADVVSGSLESIYENEDTIALVVHGWSENNDKFYHAGDKLKLRVSYTEEDKDRPGKVNKIRTEWKDYTVGAVIYRPNDDPYDDIITVYT
ncbi:MAG: ABC transporter permease, partial [Clostridia bacterium]|nr:ABC transporter permease [Clostridia bacterium]